RRDRRFQSIELGVRAKKPGPGAHRCFDAPADNVSDRLRVLLYFLGGCATGRARRDHPGTICRIQHVSIPLDLAADCDWLRRESLSARSGKRETNAVNHERETRDPRLAWSKTATAQ